MLIKFPIHGEPQGKERPRFKRLNNKVIAFTPSSTKNYEEKIRKDYSENIRHKFPKDIPIEVAIIAYYKIPNDTSKIKREKMLSGEILPVKRPDGDNIIKTILDALNGTAFHDDSQVFKIKFEKRYGEVPMALVTLVDAGVDIVNKY